MGKEFRYVGKPTPRIDGKAIVTGSAEYANDIHMHGMLYGRIKMSPHPHAMITKIDVSKALELPGVRTIMTYENAFDWVTGMPAQKRLLDRHVRFVGDPVALIAATSNRIAEEAAELIEVEYEVLPAVQDLDIGHGNLHDHFLDVGALEAAFHIALVWSVPPGNETGTFGRKRIGYGLIL